MKTKASKSKTILTKIVAIVILALLIVAAVKCANGASLANTAWSLLPPVIAIVLALITKEAYSALFIGVVVGGLFTCGFTPVATLDTILNDGLIAAISANAGIFLFLVLLGIIVALVNAAGGNVRSATVPQEQMADGGEKTYFDVPSADIQKELDLNLRGTWLPSKILTPLMLGQEGACVINISSMSAFGPLTKIPGYSAAKAGVSNYTQWLATYLARSGVRVNAIAPGFFRTEQNRALQFNPDGTPTPRVKKILAGTPMGRFGELSELIGALLFLVDERASGFVTGVVLPVDGGYSAYSGV